MAKIYSYNPTQQTILKEYEKTDVTHLQRCLEASKKAQSEWAKFSPRQRSQVLKRAINEVTLHVDSIAELINLENGKPLFEAIVNDIFPAADLLHQYCKKAPKLLATKPLKLHLMKHRRSYLEYWPKGIVAIISPWNYPFSIPFGEITLALLSGNAVLFKPSEISLQIGEKIVEIIHSTGINKDLLQLIIGDGEQGSALVDAPVDKIFFTGSVATGKKIMSAAANTLTPVVLELGGKDAMIVLEDADLDHASSAALWGGFSNSGQACASVERILVHESIEQEFIGRLLEKINTLNKLNLAGNSMQNIGVITLQKQKSVYETQLAELNESNSRVLCGGKFNAERTKLEFTVVTNPSKADEKKIEELSIYKEETFGPVVAVTTFKTDQEAIQKSNHSEYGLLASVFSKDVSRAQRIASQLEVGSVLINEVMYTHGLAETPWGGLKKSGFGKVHSDLGIYEFVNIRHVHSQRAWIKPFKSPWWFPYTKNKLKLFKNLLMLLHHPRWQTRISSALKLLKAIIAFALDKNEKI